MSNSQTSPLLAEQDDTKPVRVPRPLSNLMNGGGVGFTLTGGPPPGSLKCEYLSRDENHLNSERGKELQGKIDDEFRKAALHSLQLLSASEELPCSALALFAV